MKTVFRFTVLSFFIICCSVTLFTGCVTASFEKYHGKELKNFKDFAGFEGIWLDSNESEWELVLEKEGLPIKLIQNRRGKKDEFRAIFTEIEKGKIILWLQDRENKRMIPFRLIQSGDKSFSLLGSDSEEIKKLVEEGKIKGVLKKEQWHLEGEESVNLLKTKTFWSLDFCVNFQKRE